MTIRQSFKNILKTLQMAVPMILGILLLISFLDPIFQKYYSKIFTGNFLLDPLLGALAGSVAFGIPITSYIAGGELLEKGVSLLAVTAFILTWTTVGIAMLPMEAKYLGRRFALWRNGLNFFSSIIIAIIVTLVLRIL